MALTAVQSELSSWVISPVPRAFLPSSMTKRVRVTIFVSKAARSVMLEPECCVLGDRCGGQGRGRTRWVRGGRMDRSRRVSAPLGALTGPRQVPASVSYRGQVTVPAPGTPPRPAPPPPTGSAPAPFSVTSAYLSHLLSSTIFAVSTPGPRRHLHFLYYPPASLRSR